jgi:ubiquinol-cytochrome c reductase iron-sulfur subunit
MPFRDFLFNLRQRLIFSVPRSARCEAGKPDGWVLRVACATFREIATQGLPVTPEDKPEPSRRDFLYVATAATGGVGACACVWPLLDQMNPSSGVLAEASQEIDIAAVQPGQQMVFTWRGHPLVVRRRTEREIYLARKTELSALLDPLARNANLAETAPATDANRVIHPEWLVLTGVCTHLGCTPVPSTPAAPLGRYGGWLCRCHGSEFDTAGRVRTGPAAQNLFIPPYAFLSPTKIKVG